MSAYVELADLEAQFSKERVAEIFSVFDSGGASTGTADTTALNYAIRMGSAAVDSVLIGIHADQMPFTAPYPDTLKRLTGPFVMYEGCLSRRPEYASKPKDNPYYELCENMRAELREVRKNLLSISKDLPPANAGGEITSSNPETARPFYFTPDPDTGEGGMQGY